MSGHDGTVPASMLPGAELLQRLRLVANGSERGDVVIRNGVVASLHTGEWLRRDIVVADPLIMDERFLAAEVRGRGVTVLSACSHAGIVNACLGAKARFPATPIDLVLGGYHLAGGPMEPRIESTVEDLDTVISPRLVAPGHCTGWRAKAALVPTASQAVRAETELVTVVTMLNT